MDKTGLTLALALIIVMPLCMDSNTEKPSIAEQRFIYSLNEHNKSREELKLALDSGDDTEIHRAISKYNISVQNLDSGISELCMDKKMQEKYKETCSQSKLLGRCNIRDVEGTMLIMRVIHDPSIKKSDCIRLLALIDEQEECRTLSQSYVPSREDRAEIDDFCEKL
jgi:hypothetical protein